VARQRSSTKALLRRLAATKRIIYVLDDRRQIVYCNAACGEWLARDPESLVGQRCDYHSQAEGGELAQVAAGLCPPPDVFAGKRTRAVVRAAISASRRRAEFLPLLGAENEFAGAIVLVDDADLPEAEPAPELDGAPHLLHERLAAFRRRLGSRYSLARFAGESAQARRVRAQAALAQESATRVVIVGPEGGGAEQLAKAIHYGRGADPGWLSPLDCTLVDAELLQSALADFKRKAAESGLEKTSSLLLLDVDELAEAGQDELAGFLNLPGFELNTLATARRSPLEKADEGRFRRDLALSLSTVTIEIAPLRKRCEDIPLLAQHHLEEFNAAGGRQHSGWSDEALDRLCAYPWPGDAAELARVVQETCQKARGPVLQLADLPERLALAEDAAAQPAKVEQPIDLDEFLAGIELELIRRALEQTKGNKAAAARLLGVTRQRIISKLAAPERLAASEPEAPENLDDVLAEELP
jgi:transcriptional regulator with PAS, ATPase and Fis domain